MLEFKIKKQLREFTVDISERIGAETLVLIGHSGCGKSTTLKMLAGLLSPDEGDIHILNRVLYSSQQKVNLPPEERNIGFVFQNYALFPHLSVTANIAYGIRNLPKVEQESRVQETLVLLGLESLADSKPSGLSGGEQQRVALARALVTQPKLLLLDEPLSALDVSTRSHVRAELKELLKKLAIPTIVVTHDYEDARVLADRVAVMDQGKVIQSGTPREVAQLPANPFVAEFTGTNLVAVENPQEEAEVYVSFDPWKGKVSRTSSGGPYEWDGEIRDIVTLGGFVRLHIYGKSPFYADIPIETYETEGFQLGETVYVSVAAEEIRWIPHSPELVKKRHQSGVKEKQVQGTKKKRQGKWRWALSLAGLIIIIMAALSHGFTSKADSKTKTSKTQMFSLVAANATDPFNEFITVFEKEHPEVKVEGTYAGTQVIRTQLEQGAKADLFLSADLNHIEAVKKEGLIDAFYPVSNNHLVIVVPKDNHIGIQSLSDLGSKKLKLVIGTDTVPIGRYTRKVFENAKPQYGADFPDKVMANVVSLESDTKQVLQKVSLGEADAGLVYVTDVTADFSKQLKIIEIPKEFNVVATNYISVPKAAPHKKLADEFMKMMLSAKGQKIFLNLNYDPIK